MHLTDPHLPADWFARCCAAEPNKLDLWASVGHSLLRRRGESAMASSWVQRFVVGHLFPETNKSMEESWRKRAPDWGGVEIAIGEYTKRLHRVGSRELDLQLQAFHAEILTLELFIKRACTRKNAFRSKSSPDWLLTRSSRELSVEVKRRRNAPEDHHAYLSGAWDGMLLLVGGSWLRKWNWHPRLYPHDLWRSSTSSKMAEDIGAHLIDHRQVIAEALDRGDGQTSSVTTNNVRHTASSFAHPALVVAYLVDGTWENVFQIDGRQATSPWLWAFNSHRMQAYAGEIDDAQERRFSRNLLSTIRGGNAHQFERLKSHQGPLAYSVWWTPEFTWMYEITNPDIQSRLLTLVRGHFADWPRTPEVLLHIAGATVYSDGLSPWLG